MEINIGGKKIDFDFGKNGECNGFDAWRLLEFVIKNKIETPFNSEERIKSEIKNTEVTGEIVKGNGMGNNYYANS